MTEQQSSYDTEAATIAALARDGTAVEVHRVAVTDGRDPIEERVYGRSPDGGLALVDTIEVADLRRDHVKQGPDRLAGTVAVHTPQSLVDYANRHVDPDTSTLWGDVDNARLTVIFNDHEQLTPGWADHRVVLDLKPSPEWQAWVGHNEKGMSQEELAEFLEEHLVEVVEPDGSDLLEVTRTFHATTGATFRRAQSLHSGQVQLTWQEEGQATAGTSGQLEVPREFMLRLRPFVGTDPVRVRGQFRYRVTSGQLQLGFRLLNLDEHRRDAVETILTSVADDLALTALEGVAPSARR